MEQGAGEDPMHLYQVFQNSFNKITTTNSSSKGGTMYTDWGTDPQYLQPQQQQQQEAYMGSYDPSAYYMPTTADGYFPQQQQQQHPQPYGMVEDPTSPLWSPPCTPVSSIPPPSSSTPFYDRVKPEPDSLTGTIMLRTLGGNS